MNILFVGYIVQTRSLRRFWLLLVSAWFGSSLFAQTYLFDAEWNGRQDVFFQDQSYSFPKSPNLSFVGSELRLDFRRPLTAGFRYDASVTNLTFSSLSQEDLTYLSVVKRVVPTAVDLELKVSMAKNQPSLVLSVFPYVLDNGQLKKVVQIQVLVSKKGSVASVPAKDFVANSVLSDPSSQWFKIAVSADGMYKLDYDFLASMGVNVASLNPQHIHVYGNATGRLPEQNWVFRPDDLVKNPIQVVGEDDGTFDSGDYVVFHAFGPNRWVASGSTFTHDMNPYTTQAHYFIRISATEPPLRVADQASVSNPTNVVTSFSHYDVHDVELRSLVGGGQRFYGELFDENLVQTFNFSVPNISPGDSARFRASLASNTGGATVTFSVGSTNFHSRLVPSSVSDYSRIDEVFRTSAVGSNIPLTIRVNRPNPSILTYLDEIELNVRRSLTYTGGVFHFRDLASVGIGKRSEFVLSNAPQSVTVWDITARTQPVRIVGEWSANQFRFTVPTDSLRQFVAFDGTSFQQPVFLGTVAPQNLHGLEVADLIIVSHASFLAQANRLADLHRGEGLSVHVVTNEQVFNEFSGGVPDPTGIRWFMKMFYDRANGDVSKMPKNLLLFGDGTYDPKNILSSVNFVMTYQYLNSESHIDALVSDDYFGLLDDDESISFLDDMDIGVGRLLISDQQTAKEQVDKIEIYLKNGNPTGVATGNECCGGTANQYGNFGDWRLNYVQITDDEEGGWFINNDAEPQVNHVKSNHPEMNADKLYTDAYQQVTLAGGQRYPEVFDGISERIQRGALVMNYIGHGGEAGAAEERIITIPQIQSWNNAPRYPLFVSATCEFTKYDDPKRMSAGELVSLNPTGGAIALMTTTRSVYFSVNTNIGRRFYENVFQRDNNLEPLTFGEIIRRTKNQATSGDNKRSFTLIGDPALQLALPRLKVVVDSINGFAVNQYQDTVEALSKMRVSGHLEDQFGSILNDYEGELSPTVFDKPKDQKTLGQDPTSPIISFQTQRNAMYKGKASVKNGRFQFEFVVPKDINYAYGNGKISLYANNTVTDAAGAETRFFVGGLNANGLNDTQGPTVELFLNDENFVNGGLTSLNPILIAKIFDENGVNTVGNGIGHDIVAILDNNTARPIVLNEYYTADLDSYQSGRLEYNFSNLAPGPHVLVFKVWDVNNNSSETRLEFVVAESQSLALDHVLNYPNPFTTRTEFFFEHNQVCEALEAQIQIFTVSGKLVKTINQLVQTQGFRTEGIVWDGRDDFGDQLAKGVYVYRLSVKSPDGTKAEKIEKLVLLK